MDGRHVQAPRPDLPGRRVLASMVTDRDTADSAMFEICATIPTGSDPALGDSS